MTSRPTDSTRTMNGLYYKLGKHGLVFVWIDNQWRRSTKTAEELKGKTTSRFKTLTG